MIRLEFNSMDELFDFCKRINKDSRPNYDTHKWPGMPKFNPGPWYSEGETYLNQPFLSKL